ncbi:MAG: tRNA uridine-5-carboxymethylaminomethyl(34) synthesis GTPase MnmE, partial [Cytophagales bacterium]|nr:tRNA uridine-5-carboxymethylaminomethyl(34) synthesis GTPase MnmE [Armatimonadota bacterium]
MPDTIAAIATGTGAAGIGIVRISGPDALRVGSRITASVLVGHPLPPKSRQRSHSLRRVTVRDPETRETLDDALLAVFRAPRSLTGEHVVEIQGHGGSLTLGRVLAACFAAGARAARPGEFTERAFRNGKMDLAQAEAVAALVSSQTVAAQRAALRQVSGALSQAVRTAASALQEGLALIEASIDFPEEIGDADPALVDGSLLRAEETVQTLLATASYGRRLREGLTIVLAGRPNVGKSSLLNALSGTERAIVTEVAGTTRDIVEEALNFGGLPVRALDTAGIRQTDDPVETVGVARAWEAIRSADVVIAVLDASHCPPAEDDLRFLHSLADQPQVIAINKSDAADSQVLLRSLKGVVGSHVPLVAVSARTGEGLTTLTEAVSQTA